ncbi:hypothetical protein cypCar_00041561, partial [Cyprinus carpio]
MSVRRLQEEQKILVTEMDNHRKYLSTRAETLRELSCLFASETLEMLISNIYSGQTEKTPKPSVTIKPAQHVFRGERVTLRCDINAEGVNSWQYSWYKDGSPSVFSELQEHTFNSVNKSDAGKYSCKGSERGESRTSHRSDEVTLTVSVPIAVLNVSPQTWLTEGDPVTLICEVKGSSTGWTFRWFTLTLSS